VSASSEEDVRSCINACDLQELTPFDDQVTRLLCEDIDFTLPAQADKFKARVAKLISAHNKPVKKATQKMHG
jgi:hypothetical protein